MNLFSMQLIKIDTVSLHFSVHENVQYNTSQDCGFCWGVVCTVVCT